jgi:uncharacterized protein
MSVELRPLGVICNIACQYCYQNPHRDAAHPVTSYDLDAMKEAIEEIGGGFHLFGGEPLLIPKADLQSLWSWGLDRFGTNGLQTNGALLDDDHIRMILDYRVSVGVSIDGPGELNDARWAGTLERTREATRRSELAIYRLCNAGVIPGVMIQLTRCNASLERLPLLTQWLRNLHALGVRVFRLHILEVNNPLVRAKYSLSQDENRSAFFCLAQLFDELDGIRFDVFDDILNNLSLRDSGSSCVWRGCDAYTTEAVDGVGGKGERHNCGLTDKEGIDFQKPEHQGYERYLTLYHTDWNEGGCRRCRFFLSCKGQCPGTGIDSDWRNRTENCEVWKSIHEWAEARVVSSGKVPVSLHPRREELEQAMLDQWMGGKNPPVEHVARRLSINTDPDESDGKSSLCFQGARI